MKRQEKKEEDQVGVRYRYHFKQLATSYEETGKGGGTSGGSKRDRYQFKLLATSDAETGKEGGTFRWQTKPSVLFNQSEKICPTNFC
jgi:hypothetical protein